MLLFGPACFTGKWFRAVGAEKRMGLGVGVTEPATTRGKNVVVKGFGFWYMGGGSALLFLEI